MGAECTCPLAPEEYQHRYGGATEPGSALEYDLECPEHGQSRPECPKGNPTAVTTSAEGSQAASEALSGQSPAFPAVWWSPSGGYFEQAPDDPATFDTLMVGDGLGSEGLPADAQRLVPVGALLEYATNLDVRAALANELAEGASADCIEGYAGKAEARAECARGIRRTVASLLGESPESHAQEGNQ